MLTCVSDGVPLPEVTFYFNGEDIKDDDERITINGYIVTIDELEKSDDGMYHCAASNAAGSVESSQVRVTTYG